MANVNLTALLFSAIENGNSQEVENLLDSDVDINSVNPGGNEETPLHVAVRSGNLEVIKLILTKGANSEALDAEGQKPIELCSHLDDQRKQEVEDLFKTIKTYTKRPGTAGVGQFFEIKLLTMVLFRLLHDDQIKDFYLGNNLDEAGAFDDIVVRTRVGGKFQVYCLQAKHKNANHNVNFNDMICIEDKKGNFSLRKYFESYLSIRYSFSQTSDHVIFQGDYNQTQLELIIFTPARISFPTDVEIQHMEICDKFSTNNARKSIKVKCAKALLDSFIDISKEWHNKNNLKIMSVSNKNAKNTADYWLLSDEQHEKLIQDFFDKLRLYSEQSTEENLEEVIQQDIRVKNYEQPDIIYSKTYPIVEQWWKQSGQVKYFIKNDNIFEMVSSEVRLNTMHENSFSKIGMSFIKFRLVEALVNPKWVNLNQEIAKRKSFIVNFYSILPEFSCVKLIQYFQWHKIEFRFLVIDKPDFKNVLEIISKVKQQFVYLVFLPQINSETENIVRIIKKCVVITKQEYRGDWKSLRDVTNSLLDFESECQKMVLGKMITFQDSPTTLGSLMKDAPKALIDGMIVHRLISGKDLVISKCCSSHDEEGSECFIDRALLDSRNKEYLFSEIADKVIVVAAEPGMGKTTFLSGVAKAMKKDDPLRWIVRINLLDYSKQFLDWKNEVNEDNALSLLMKAMTGKKNNQPNQQDSFEQNIFQWYCEQSKIILLIDGFDEISPDFTSVVLQLLEIYKSNFTEKLWIMTRTGGVQQILKEHIKVSSYTLKPFTEEQTETVLCNYWNTKLGITPDQRIVFKEYVEQLMSHLSEAIDRREHTLMSIPLQLKMVARIFQSDLEVYLKSSGKSKRLRYMDLDILYDKFIRLKFNVLSEEKTKSDLSNPITKKIYDEKFQSILKKYKEMAIYVLFCSTEKQFLLSKDEIDRVQEFIKEIQYTVEETGFITRVVDGNPIFVHQTFAEFFAAQFIWGKFSSLENEAFNELIEHIFIKSLIENEMDQVTKFMLVMAQKNLMNCSNKSFKIKTLLDRLMGSWPTTWRNFKRISFSMILGIVESSITAGGEVLIELETHLKNKSENLLNLLCLKASESGYITLVRLVTNLRAEPIHATLEGWTALHFSAIGGHVEIVKYLLENSANIHSVTKETGQTALHMAAEQGHYQIGKFLLDYGADVNASMIDIGITPIHLAAREGFTDVVALLLERGAVIDSVTTVDGETALHIASEKSHLGVVQQLLGQGSDINKKTKKDGLTPLYVATKHGHIGIVTALLENGSNPNIDNRFAFTPLQEAALKNMVEIASLLLEKGASVDGVANSYSKTPLQLAVLRKHTDIVKLLFKHGANVGIGTIYDGRTLLHEAARNNSWEIATMLLAKGADIDSITTEDGKTSLMFAIEMKHLEMTKLLIGEGANVNIATQNRKWTALHYAALKNVPEIIQQLIGKGANINCTTKGYGRTPLYVAVIEGAKDAVQILLNLEADIDLIDISNKFTPLHCAAQYNHPEIIQQLIGKGANINCTTKGYGRTPLYVASLNGAINAVNKLLGLGANVHLGEIDDGYTPLHCAAQNNHPKIIQLLIDNGANIDCTTTDNGRTPLYEASLNGAINAVHKLLGLGANVHLGEIDDGYTPLHCATVKNHPEIIQLLIDNGANIDCTTLDGGHTPLHMAARRGHLEVVRILLEHGANINIRTKQDGSTPLSLAAQGGFKEVVELISTTQQKK